MFSTCPASSCLDQSHARSSSCHSWTPFLLWRIPPRLATGKRTLISHYQSRNTYFSAYFILSCNSQFPSAPPPPAARKHLCSETAGRFNLCVCRASDSTLCGVKCWEGASPATGRAGPGFTSSSPGRSPWLVRLVS